MGNKMEHLFETDHFLPVKAWTFVQIQTILNMIILTKYIFSSNSIDVYVIDIIHIHSLQCFPPETNQPRSNPIKSCNKKTG